VEGDSSSSSELEIDLGTGARWHDFRATRLLDGLVVNVRDLTARRQEEAHRIKDRGLGGVGRFARVLAHEVRNPLTNIHLALEQLREELPPEVAENAEPYTGILERNAKRIEQHITQLLHASRSLEVELRPNAIANVMSDVIEQVRDRSKLLEIELEAEVPDDLPPVEVDPETLTIALVNLCVNAMEAMQEGKGRLLLRAHASEDHVMVELSDNGKGMSYEQQERIFQPFFSGRSGGMGLGLTEARNILEAHSAGVSVKSREGGGTTFLLSFRIASAAVSA
jgi:signal transduction histidine kinase